MDTFFVSHGSPTLAIDDSFQARSFLQSWREKVMGGHAPKAILMVSGHWDTSSPHVNAVSGPCDTIHDFYGFPPHMYKLKYPAHGAPWVATRVKELLDGAGFGPVKVDRKRGLDHGAWVPLMLMYPEADVPICQLSVESSKDGTYHYNLGKALAPLKNEGILVIGSGSATHNLRSAQPDGTPIAHWALEFDKWLKDAVLGGKIDELNDFQKKAPYAKMAHPWPDHFYPLHVALGAAGTEAKAELIHDSWSNGTFSYATFRFSDATR